MEKIEAFKPDYKTKDNSISLNYIKKGMLFDSNKEVRLVFDTPQQMDFFREVFNQITVQSAVPSPAQTPTQTPKGTVQKK